jgi:CrcB protein
MDNNNIINYLYIAIGGALGSVFRVYLSSIVPSLNNVFYLNKLPDFVTKIPISILVINILGCLIMGLLAELFGVHQQINYSLRLFLFSGFLGGFTTFSAFSLEFGLLWQKELYFSASLYCLFSVAFSVMAFFVGVKAVKLIYNIF